MSAPTTPQPAPRKTHTARATGVVALAVMCSRVLGLVREVAFAALFGGSRLMDAFQVAFRIPNLLRDLFAEGALSTAFVTTFSKRIAAEGEASAWQLANKMVTLTAVFMSGITLLGILCTPWIVSLLAAGFDDPAQKALTVTLARIMYPFILLVSLAALAMGMLNSQKIFGVPAMASSFFNLGSIISGVSIGWFLDPGFGEKSLAGLAIGTLVGGFLQFAIQLPTLYKTGYRFHLDFSWKDKGVRQVLALMAPAVIAASAVQVNVMVNTTFASYLGPGAVSWLNWAFRLMQLPIGLFGVAVATVTLPQISADAGRKDPVAFRDNLAKGIRLAFALTIPCAIGLMVLAEPIIALIFQYREFKVQDTVEVAGALRFYATGLVSYSGIKVLAPAFYALDMRKTPMLISFIAIGTNLVLNWLLTFQLGLGHRGLALSTGLVASINFLTLYVLMRNRLGRLNTIALLATTAKLAFCGALLALVCYLGAATAIHWALDKSLFFRALALFSTIALAGSACMGLALLLRIEEIEDFYIIIRQKLKPTR